MQYYIMVQISNLFKNSHHEESLINWRELNKQEKCRWENQRKTTEGNHHQTILSATDMTIKIATCMINRLKVWYRDINKKFHTDTNRNWTAFLVFIFLSNHEMQITMPMCCSQSLHIFCFLQRFMKIKSQEQWKTDLCNHFLEECVKAQRKTAKSYLQCTSFLIRIT